MYHFFTDNFFFSSFDNFFFSLTTGCISGGAGDVADMDVCCGEDTEWGVAQGPGEECEGDCDNDSQCKGDLVCFHRDGNSAITGCGAGGEGDVNHADYCYHPTTPTKPCEMCIGDCDDDDQCAGTLQCFHDDGIEHVPGCTGKRERWQDNDLKDYCHEPLLNYKDEDFCTTPPALDFQGWTPNTEEFDRCSGWNCKNLGDTCVEQGGQICCTGNNNGCKDGSCWHHKSDNGKGDCSAPADLGVCEGDCDNDNDCRGALKCYERSQDQKVPGCEGGGIGDVIDADFCYEPMETNQVKPCKACDGDCDKDSDCEGRLKCFQREDNEDVPGCSRGGVGDTESWADYCAVGLNLFLLTLTQLLLPRTNFSFLFFNHLL